MQAYDHFFIATHSMIKDHPLQADDINAIRRGCAAVRDTARKLRGYFMVIGIVLPLMAIALLGSWTSLAIAMVISIAPYTIAVYIIGKFASQRGNISLRIDGEELVDPMDESLFRRCQNDLGNMAKSALSSQYVKNVQKQKRPLINLDEKIVYFLDDLNIKA
jgi:hypothetical protein